MTDMFVLQKSYLVHKVDGSSQEDENFMKSIKWTVHPRRMKILLSP